MKTLSWRSCTQPVKKLSAVVGWCVLNSRTIFSYQRSPLIITLPLLPPIIHPGAMLSPGRPCICTWPATWSQRKHDSSSQAIFFHCSVVQFWRSYTHFFWHFCSGRGSAWAPLPLCTNKASSVTSCNAAWSHLAIWAALAQAFVPHLTLLPCSLLWSDLDPSRSSMPHKSCSFGTESTQSDSSCQTGSHRFHLKPQLWQQHIVWLPNMSQM